MEQNKNNLQYGLFAIISSGGLLLSYSFYVNLIPGQFVCVPIKNGKMEKKCIAVFMDLCEKPDFECRDIFHLMPYKLSLKPIQLNILKRVSSYYLTPIEWCIRLLAPSFFWKLDKFPSVTKYFEIVNTTQKQEKEINFSINLNSKQSQVFDFIVNNLKETILLHGVTGSGKTEVYLAVAQYMIKKGKNCLILVPEISLTPQMEGRFRKVFGNLLSVMHSGVSSVAFLKEWLSVYSGKTRIVLGVRSAVFCPLENVGLIIVDEEHDQSYKSSEKPCYHARDVAVMRSKLENACCILGSATPSLESFLNTKNQKYKYVEIKNKHAEFTKVDTLVFETKDPNKKFKLVKQNTQECHIEKEILNLLQKTHKEGFQSIVLINRRGFVNYALCDQCKTPLSCPNCSVATTIHNFGKREICHYCNFNQEIRKSCPECHNDNFLLKGIGTQNIESYLKNEIQDFKVDRLDRDTVTSHTRLTKILEKFASHQTDCLVGTQILAKGHDFQKVTLIVILNLEDGLFLPDFRASEKTFHLLTQSMGRVGRGKYPGIVALQSMTKKQPVIELALEKQVNLFLERELKNRKIAHLPPYVRFILIELKHENKLKLEKNAQQVKNLCIDFWKLQKLDPSDVFLSGPYDAPIERINKIFRMHICLHTAKHLHPNYCVPKSIYRSQELKSFVKIDVDPQNFM